MTFSIRSGEGTITDATAVTNASGIATLGNWVLGIGGNSLFASVPGLSGIRSYSSRLARLRFRS